MSRVDVEANMEAILKSKAKVFVLFYATWCPFCRQFLPIFEKFAKTNTRHCEFVVIDDKPSLREEYEIDVVPTILVFQDGKIIRRLDGLQGIGLNERDLMNLVAIC